MPHSPNPPSANQPPDAPRPTKPQAAAAARETLQTLNRDIPQCRRCPRLVAWRERAARDKRPAYRDHHYWARPVPSFGPHDARILIVGLAPAAHGANRTGRMFTGDRSGDVLYRAIYDAGLSNQPHSTDPDDGLQLHHIRIASVVRCAPPDNRPTTTERDNCLPWLRQELQALPDLRVILCLGAFAWQNIARELNLRPRPKFAHALQVDAPPLTLLCSYHPSQRNTFTGLLTPDMLTAVLIQAATLSGLTPTHLP